MSQPVLKVQNLTKRYKGYTAVDNISFEIPSGKVIGLLGPNGAGKTTTIQMLLGITLADKGSICYFGRDFYTHRQECLQNINFASSFNSLQGKISVIENLKVFAMLYNIADATKKIDRLSEQLELGGLMDDLYHNLSAGQKTRVNIAKALLNDPKLILMDEPTASLDPDISDKLLSIIEDLRKESHLSILYTSHDMNEVARVCDEVIFLDHGKIIAHDTPLGLTKQIKTATLKLVFEGERQKVESYIRESGATLVHIDKTRVQLKLPEQQIAEAIFGVSKTGAYITDVEVEKPTLEDFFLHIARKNT
ncbi:ABC transporter ATP-binding protein [Candidatus Microgenomates bacterium]|nr:ABC transporter ATP-binding protein [Candidatus Microgenomates bacterium]